MIGKKTQDYIDRLTLVLAGTTVAIMIFHVCTDVIGKYLFSLPVPGTITIVTTYYMPIITFLPLAFVQARGNHISVEILTNTFPRAVQRHLHGWVLLFCAIIALLLAYYSGQEAFTKYNIGAFQIEQGYRVPIWPGRFCPTLGYGLFSILLFMQFFNYLLGKPPAQSHVELL